MTPYSWYSLWSCGRQTLDATMIHSLATSPPVLANSRHRRSHSANPSESDRITHAQHLQPTSFKYKQHRSFVTFPRPRRGPLVATTAFTTEGAAFAEVDCDGPGVGLVTAFTFFPEASAYKHTQTQQWEHDKWVVGKTTLWHTRFWSNKSKENSAQCVLALVVVVRLTSVRCRRWRFGISWGFLSRLVPRVRGRQGCWYSFRFWFKCSFAISRTLFNLSLSWDRSWICRAGTCWRDLSWFGCLPAHNFASFRRSICHLLFTGHLPWRRASSFLFHGCHVLPQAKKPRGISEHSLDNSLPYRDESRRTGWQPLLTFTTGWGWRTWGNQASPRTPR